MQRIGLILAAGRGRRMGRTKQLIPWPVAGGEKPLVAAAFDAICGVCERMIVVLGHEAEAVATALGKRNFDRVLSDPDVEMFASICTGLTAARRIDENATIVLQPGDHPVIQPGTVAKLIAAADADPSVAVMPENQGRGGHPVLIPPAVAAQILAAPVGNGLAGFWADNPHLCRRVPVDDSGIFFDVDTPEQLSSGKELYG